MRFKVRVWRMLKAHQRIQVLQYRVNSARRSGKEVDNELP
ncbi:hypothetical protein SAMN05444487_12124 [Marininema mesophilum]|uniref:Uncharacterized protein n=1 Tax=Marininema mesophilum TaxID=1048340 RepID=A0A1H3CCL0_9BACL|nr:hypothetical protein SAMN05444487_12124 [Marininema mesophilum]